MAPIHPDMRLLNLLTAQQAHQYQLIPFEQEGNQLHCYTQQADIPQRVELEFFLGCTLQAHPLDAATFERHLVTCYPRAIQQVQAKREKLAQSEDVIQRVEQVFQEAVALGTSDIHIERYERSARIRFRWEGELIEKYEVPLDQYDALVSRIKILAELDISERRLPQDGRIKIHTQDPPIDVRVSTLPGKFGEKVVLRLLTRSPRFLQLTNLGMQASQYEAYQEALRQPNGIILITGPTSSGKTTTLYASLNQLNQSNKNILTVEDPIEYNLEGINQVQVKQEIGLTFSRALRAFLRQDPDIIMVGEIRDQQTAEIAVRAALTGHLVFSTLHTNSAADAVGRLTDMGIAPYLLAASLRLIAAQRLIRILCPNCKQPQQDHTHAPLRQRWDLHELYEPVGCNSCHYTGYQGRKAIYEMIPIDDELAGHIKAQSLDQRTYLNLYPDALTLQTEVLGLLRKGETSLAEALPYLSR